jgi:hypothetical protein
MVEAPVFEALSNFARFNPVKRKYAAMNRCDIRRPSIIHNNCNYALLSDGSFGERTPVVVNIGGGRTDVRGTSEINRSHGDFVGSKPYRSSGRSQCLHV